MNGDSHKRGSGDNGFVRPFRRDPYAVLNLPRSRHGEWRRRRPVGDDEIRDSYKRLSRLLHPDKRPPGREREDAQELFIEMQHAYEILEDPALRQAYDHFGHSAVALIRHHRYAPDSLYQNLSALHDDGRSSEALGVLRIVLEDAKRRKRQEEWEFDADVEVNLHASADNVGGAVAEWPDVSSTSVSLTASVPVPTQTAGTPFPSDDDRPPRGRKNQKLQLSIGGRSNLENGMGATRGMLSANYKPVSHMTITSDLAVGQEQLETSISSSTQLTNGTGLSAKMSRQCPYGGGKEGNLSYGFSSHRTLSIFHGRTVHAVFALGVGSELRMQYGILSLTTWGFRSAADRKKSDNDNDDVPPPRISAKLQVGTQFPVECSVHRSHLFGSPHRSGRATVAWSPLAGFKWKGSMHRKISERCGRHESEFASEVGVGVEHTPLSGLKWLISYRRPEGLTVRVPIFLSSFLSPAYWNKVVWVLMISFLLDETIEELVGSSSPEDGDSDPSSIHNRISARIRTNQNEWQWLGSSRAKRDAERQLCMIAPIAEMKRAREESIDGLVILKATYASVASLSSKNPSNVSLDVTRQMQFWVERSRLYLPPSSKKGLLGIYDLNARDHRKADQLMMNKVNGGKTDGHLTSLLDRWTFAMNVWLSRLGVGEANVPHQTNSNQKDNSSGDDESVTLCVRYKCKGQVFEISVGDNDALELPCSDATILGRSDLVS